MTSTQTTPRTAEALRVLAWPAWKGSELNPYTSLLYDSMLSDCNVSEFSFRALVERKYDVIHMHWPETVTHGGTLHASARTVALALGLLWARAGRRGVVWTRHNRTAHSGPHPRLATLVERIALRASTSLIYLSNASKDELESQNVRQVPAIVTPHGRYAPSTSISGPPKDRALPTVAWFGRVRAYKGLDRLLEVSIDPTHWQLAVAGQPDDEDLATLVAQHVFANGGTALLRHLSETELDRFLGEAHLVCLPYRQFQNSGSVFRALAAQRPVLVPRTATMIELSADIGAGWIHMYDDELSPSDITRALEAGVPAIPPNWTRYEWPTIAAFTVSAYRAALPQAVATPSCT